jgi:hydroxymethylpyrimidine/phosphomethylpyrimidine kinase
MKYPVLSIAGFDGSGGAGIQADLKTFSALGCYGMNVLTALPVQNTCGVQACYGLPLSSIYEQLETIFNDIPPLAIKIGMLFSAQVIEIVSDFLSKHAAHLPIVLDPVMYAKSGDILLQAEAVEGLVHRLLPLVSIVTPNLPEACRLLNVAIDPQYDPDPISLANLLIQKGVRAVLVKGGHAVHSQYMRDIFQDAVGGYAVFTQKRISSNHTHGTGCTLSAAITAYLAQGYDIRSACFQSNNYLHGALLAAQYQSLGHGHGPVHHFYQWW